MMVRDFGSVIRDCLRDDFKDGPNGDKIVSKLWLLMNCNSSFGMPTRQKPKWLLFGNPFLQIRKKRVAIRVHDLL
jgi:hypothetical protein